MARLEGQNIIGLVEVRRAGRARDKARSAVDHANRELADIIRQAVHDGTTMTDVAAALKISRQALYEFMDRYPAPVPTLEERRQQNQRGLVDPRAAGPGRRGALR